MLLFIHKHRWQILSFVVPVLFVRLLLEINPWLAIPAFILSLGWGYFCGSMHHMNDPDVKALRRRHDAINEQIEALNREIVNRSKGKLNED